MEAEAAPLLAHLGLQRDSPLVIPPPAPCASYSGTRGGVAIHVVVNGKCLVHGVDNVGTVPAALTAYLAVQAFDPDLVISTGTAGGFRAQGAAIGDVFLSTAMLNHDRRIPIGVGGGSEERRRRGLVCLDGGMCGMPGRRNGRRAWQ